MLEITLYDSEFCYNFDLIFKGKESLNEFMNLNKRFEIFEE